jgi:CBS domain-containing protein
MSTAIYNTAFASLAAEDTVADALEQMLGDRVSDLPVLDADGRFLGLLSLQRLLGMLLPKAAIIGDDGVPDLSFTSETLDRLRERVREIEDTPVRELAVKPEHVVSPEVSPVEIVLLLHRGANSIPVVEPGTGMLVGMATARDVLAAIHGGGSR